MNKEKLNKELDKWLTRSLPDSFFEKAGTYDKNESKKLFEGIPKEYKLLAYTIISLTYKFPDVDCLTFRLLLYKQSEDLKKENIDLLLPHYWYKDGVMIIPEFIVRITNGIVGWKCDNSYKECGMKDGCRYYPFNFKVIMKG